MVERLSVDTTFLIDLQRERRATQTDGPAHEFLRQERGAELYLSTVALGEFAEGFPSPQDPVVLSVRQHHVLLPVDEESSLLYAATARAMRRQGILIGTNDLWIGCSSLRHGLPLLTANVSEFRRIEGLTVIAYL